MFCTSCGQELPIGAGSCPACNAAVPGRSGPQPSPQAVELELLRLGPFGVSISRTRPGAFVAVMKNCTEVVATDRRLVGVRKPGCLAGLLGGGGGKPTFEVPWSAVVTAERADFLGNRAIHLRYRCGDRTQELGVIAALGGHAALEGLWRIVEERVAARRA